MDTLREPDWLEAKTKLVDESAKAISSFADVHSLELCSCFALSVDYCFGNISICFDTLQNSIQHAKVSESRILNSRDSLFVSSNGWANAKYYLQREQLCAFSSLTADFQFPDFGRIHFSDWEGYFLADQQPEHPDPIGHVIVLMHKVIRDLVTSGVFDRLRTSSPFRIGVEFPDDLGFVVMAILKW